MRRANETKNKWKTCQCFRGALGHLFIGVEAWVIDPTFRNSKSFNASAYKLRRSSRNFIEGRQRRSPCLTKLETQLRSKNATLDLNVSTKQKTTFGCLLFAQRSRKKPRLCFAYNSPFAIHTYIDTYTHIGDFIKLMLQSITTYKGCENN